MKMASAWRKAGPSVMAVPFIIFFGAIRLAMSNQQPFSQRQPFLQRCFGEEAVSNISLFESPAWLESSCRPCTSPHRRSSLNTTNNRPMHAIIQLTTPKLQPEFLSIAAGLLAENVNVTVFYMNFDRPTIPKFDHILWEGVLAGVPCTQDASEHLRPTLSLQAINIPPSLQGFCSRRLARTSFYAETMQSCSVISATNQYRALANAVFGQGHHDDPLPFPEIIVTDFHGFGALVFAEKLGIPSFIVADETSFYDNIGRGVRELSTWQYIQSLPREFFRSFLATKAFSDLNQMRRLLGLEPKRHLNGFWDVATSIFVVADQYQSESLPQQRNQFPPLLTFPFPIISPCVSCGHRPRPLRPLQFLELSGGVEPTSLRDKLTVVVLLPLEGLIAAEAREIVRGLSMARKSVLTTTDASCKPGGSTLCWPDAIDLQVKWLLTDATNHRDLTMHPLPHFIEHQDSSLYLDNILRSFQPNNTSSNNKTIVVADCDTDVRASLLLRIPTICLPSKAGTKSARTKESSDAFRVLEKIDSKEVATQVMRFLHTLRNAPQDTMMPYYDNSKGDSLKIAVTAIRGAGDVLINDPGMPVFSDAGYKGAEATERRRTLQRSYAAAMEERGVTLAPRYILDPNLPFALTMRYWVAYGVLFLSCSYLATKRVFPGVGRSLRTPLRNVQHHELKLFLEASIARLPEFGVSLAALREFWKDRDNLRRQRLPGQTESTNGRQNGKASGSKSSSALHKKRTGKHR